LFDLSTTSNAESSPMLRDYGKSDHQN